MKPKQWLFIQSFRQECVFFDTGFPIPFKKINSWQIKFLRQLFPGAEFTIIYNHKNTFRFQSFIKNALTFRSNKMIVSKTLRHCQLEVARCSCPNSFPSRNYLFVKCRYLFQALSFLWCDNKLVWNIFKPPKSCNTVFAIAIRGWKWALSSIFLTQIIRRDWNLDWRSTSLSLPFS